MNSARLKKKKIPGMTFQRHFTDQVELRSEKDILFNSLNVNLQRILFLKYKSYNNMDRQCTGFPGRPIDTVGY